MSFCTLNQVNFNNFPGNKFTFEKLTDYLSAGGDPNGFVDDSPVLQLYSGDARCVEDLSIEEMEKCLNHKNLCTISIQDFVSTYISPIIQKKKFDSAVQSGKSSIMRKL